MIVKRTKALLCISQSLKEVNHKISLLKTPNQPGKLILHKSFQFLMLNNKHSLIISHTIHLFFLLFPFCARHLSLPKSWTSISWHDCVPIAFNQVFTFAFCLLSFNSPLRNPSHIFTRLFFSIPVHFWCVCSSWG